MGDHTFSPVLRWLHLRYRNDLSFYLGSGTQFAHYQYNMRSAGVGKKPKSQNGKTKSFSKVWLCLGIFAFALVLFSPGKDQEPGPQTGLSRQELLGRLRAEIDRNRQPTFTPSPQPPPEDAYSGLPDVLPPAPALGEAERLRLLQAQDVLLDPMDRVDDEFVVPRGLDQRVRFWFDIYTRHGRFTHVIHHTRYPWITYEVMDFSAAVRDGKGPEWLKVERATKMVARRRAEIRQALRRLSYRPGVAKTQLEKHLVAVLSKVPGRRAQVYRQAAASLRSQLGQRDAFIAGLRRSSRYLPYLEESFFSTELPLDLTRMPFVESSFNEYAESKVGASGIWQVMPATGRAYGKVGDQIDERNSPFKATNMAARLLRSYHKALGSWPLAVTAYNHGIGNIQQAIRAARSRDLTVIIERYHHGDFKFASSNFYTCFLAALYAERYSEVVFPSVVREAALSHERFLITRHIPLTQLVQFGDLNIQHVLEHNLDLNRPHWRRIVLPKGFVLHLPPGHGELLPQRLRARMRLIPGQPTQVSELIGSKDKTSI